MGLMQSGSNFTDRIVKYVAKRAERKTKPASPPMGHVIPPCVAHFEAQNATTKTPYCCKTCLQEEWDKITPETLHHLVSSVPKRLLSVVKRNGNITKW